MPRTWMRIAVLCWACAVTGCANRCAWRHAAPADEVLELPQRLVQRQTITPDVSAVGTHDEVRQVVGVQPLPSQYQALTAMECQCRAASHAALANLIGLERGVTQSAVSQQKCVEARLARVQRELFGYRAVEERNRAAGLALDAFYQLTDAESKRDTLSASLTEVDQNLKSIKELTEQGLRVELDEASVGRERLALVERQTQLSLGIVQLNAQLRYLLGIHSPDLTPFWPEADLTVVVEPLDLDAEIAQGLENRADLGLLRMLSHELDDDTLPLVRSAMGQLHSGLTALTPRMKLLHVFLGLRPGGNELQTRRAQLAQYITQREQLAAAEIRQAVETVRTRLQQISLENEKLTNWNARLEDLQSRRGMGATPFEISAAQLEVIRAQSDLLHAVIAWRIAQVKLRESQGLLATECGFIPNQGGACRGLCEYEQPVAVEAPVAVEQPMTDDRPPAPIPEPNPESEAQQPASEVGPEENVEPSPDAEESST